MITFTYVDFGLYCALLLFALRNIWVVVIKKQRYKRLPIPAFYTFAVVTLTLRPFFIIGSWTDDWKFFVNLDWVQQGAKLCVGLVQDWVTVELAVRIHVSKGVHDISKAGINRLRAIFKIVYLALVVGFIAWIITVIVSDH